MNFWEKLITDPELGPLLLGNFRRYPDSLLLNPARGVLAELDLRRKVAGLDS